MSNLIVSAPIQHIQHLPQPEFLLSQYLHLTPPAFLGHHVLLAPESRTIEQYAPPSTPLHPVTQPLFFCCSSERGSAMC